MMGRRILDAMVALGVLVLVGCHSTSTMHLPDPAELRAGNGPTDIKRVVYVDDSCREITVDFATVEDVRWTESELTLAGVREEDRDPNRRLRDTPRTEYTFALTDIRSITVRQFDAGETALFVVAIGGAAGLAFGLFWLGAFGPVGNCPVPAA